MIVQRPETPREGDVLVRRPVHAAKDDHMMAVPRIADRIDIRIGKNAGDTDAADFRAERVSQRNDLHI